MANPQAGDIGTKIRYNAQESLAAQTVLKLKWKKKPIGEPQTTGEWAASVYDTNYAEYTTLTAADLLAGVMEIQIYIETLAWKGHSEMKEFTIDPNVS